MSQAPFTSIHKTGDRVCPVCKRMYPAKFYDDPAFSPTGRTCWCCTVQGGDALRHFLGYVQEPHREDVEKQQVSNEELRG